MLRLPVGDKREKDGFFIVQSLVNHVLFVCVCVRVRTIGEAMVDVTRDVYLYSI